MNKLSLHGELKSTTELILEIQQLRSQSQALIEASRKLRLQYQELKMQCQELKNRLIW